MAVERKRAVGCARTAAMHKRVALMALAGLCLGSASAFQPPARLVRRAVAGPCASASRRAPPLRVAMQFQSREAGTSTQRRSSFQMPKTNPISSRREPEGPLEDDPSLPMVEDIIRALDDRKAQGIWAVRVAHLTYSTEFFINCHGTSRPMLQAIAGSVEDTMLEKYERPIKWQGNPDSGWILLDYGEVIVNIMTEQAREFYDLEDHWSNGELVPLQGLVTPMDAFESQVQRRGVLARVRPCQCGRRLVRVSARTRTHIYTPIQRTHHRCNTRRISICAHAHSGWLQPSTSWTTRTGAQAVLILSPSGTSSTQTRTATMRRCNRLAGL